jgi:protein TonB
MELKKNPKVDVRGIRLLLLLIAGIVTLTVVCLALALAFEESEKKKTNEAEKVVEDEEIVVTRQEEKKIEPPKVQKVEIKVYSDVLKIVTNEEKVETEINFDEFQDNVEFITQVEVVEEQVEDDQPFVVAEQMPSFNGGDIRTFHAWVQREVRYPMIAQENGITGRVLLSFVVEKDGSLGQIRVLQTPDQSLADEAIRVLQSSPKWVPGKQRNKTVRVSFTLPVEFRLQN